MEEDKPMTKEEWAELLDAELLYILLDEFECYINKVNEINAEKTPEESIDALDRILKALVMFHSRAISTIDLTITEYAGAQPNVIAMTSMMHFIHAYLTTRNAGEEKFRNRERE